MTQSTPELLPVVQADRDAAADYFRDHFAIGWGANRRIRMREFGEYDGHPLVQAFARHRIEHSTPDRNAVPETVPDQIERVMSSKWLDPECGEDGCQSRKWKQLYEQAVQGRRDFRQAYKEARSALSRTPEPTDHAGVSEMAQVPVCRSCGEPSPNGDPCETCVECERILAMSDEEVVAEAGPEGMAWARGFKEGLRTGLSARTPPVLEVAKEALEPFAALGEGVDFDLTVRIPLADLRRAQAALQTIGAGQ